MAISCRQKNFDVPCRYIIGTHPTSLPYNRGRHPLHWMISMGINRSEFNFFVMDEGVDSGAILHQEPFSLENDGTINDAIIRMDQAAERGLHIILDHLDADPNFVGLPQKNEEKANYWRKKTMADVTLDPRMTILTIDRIVRSFTTPYPCAALIIKGEIIEIVATRVDDNTFCSQKDLDRMAHGRIVNVFGKNLVLKVADGLITLVASKKLESTIGSLRHIHPPSYYYNEFGDILKQKLA